MSADEASASGAADASSGGGDASGGLSFGGAATTAQAAAKVKDKVEKSKKGALCGEDPIYPIWHVISGNMPVPADAGALHVDSAKAVEAMEEVGAWAADDVDGVDSKDWQVHSGNTPVHSKELWYALQEDDHADGRTTPGGTHRAVSAVTDDTWEELTDAFTRQPFYINRYSGQRRNTRPTDEGSGDDSDDDPSLPGDWVRLVDPSTGRLYYFSELMKMTSWVRPDDAKGTGLGVTPQGGDADDDGDSAAGGDASGAGAGSGGGLKVATGGSFRSPDGGIEDWEVKVDSSNRRFYYSRSRHESRWAPAGKGPVSDWISMKDEVSGRTYYYSASRRKTAWTIPVDDADKPVAGEAAGAGSGAGAGAGGDDDDSSDEDLPPLPSEEAARSAEQRALRKATEDAEKAERDGSGSPTPVAASPVSRRRSLKRAQSRKLTADELSAVHAGIGVAPPPSDEPHDGASGGSDDEDGLTSTAAARRAATKRKIKAPTDSGGGSSSAAPTATADASIPATPPPAPPPATAPHRHVSHDSLEGGAVGAALDGESADDARARIASLPPPSVADSQRDVERARKAKEKELELFKDHQGWVYKKGGGKSLLGRQSWQRRFLVLKDGKMAYYKTDKAFAAGKAPMKNVYVDVARYTVNPMHHSNDEFSLEPILRQTEAAAAATTGMGFASPAADRSFEFRTDDPVDKKAWLAALMPSKATLVRVERRRSRMGQDVPAGAGAAAGRGKGTLGAVTE